MSRKDLRAYLSLAAILATQTVTAASAETLPIKKISVDGSKQLVVEFGGAAGNFPSAPHVLDLPGPNHRVVLDFSDASLDKANLPSADEVSAAVTQALPFVKSVRYSNLENAPAPTARIVLDVPEDAKLKPRVVKLEEGNITISLGDELPSTATTSGAAKPDVATTLADASTPAAGETPIGVEETKPAETVPTATTPTTPTESWDWKEKSAEATTAAPTPDAGNAGGGLTPDSGAPTTVTPVSTAPTPVTTADTTTAAPEPGPEGLGAPTPEAAVPAVTETTPAPAAGTESTPATSGDAAEDKKVQSVKKYNSAVQFHLQGKLNEAIAEYKAALEINPQLAEAHSNLGLIYNQMHNYGQALAEFRKALAINPKDAITYNGIGAALRAEKDLLGAIKNWQTAVNLDPKLATAHYNLGTAYEIQKEYEKALASYNSAVKNDYRLGEAYYRMGLIMERKKRPDDAAQQFQEALKVSGDSEYSEDARQRLAFLNKNKKSSVK